MASMLVAEISVPDIIATILDVLAVVNSLVKADRRHASGYLALKTALLQLRDQVKRYKDHLRDGYKSTELLVRARISVSKTCSLVERLVDHPPDWSPWCLCWTDDGELEELQSQLDQTHTLVDDLSSYLQSFREDEDMEVIMEEVEDELDEKKIFMDGLSKTRKQPPVVRKHGRATEDPTGRSLFEHGVTSLAMVVPMHLGLKPDGNYVIAIPVIDNSSQKLVYTLKICIDHETWSSRTGKIWASLNRERTRKQDKKEWHIRRPEGLDEGFAERNALISSSDGLQAEVRSLMPHGASGVLGAGTLLQRSSNQTYYRHVRHYQSAKSYHVELLLKGTVIVGLQEETVHWLRVLGRKESLMTYYQCTVDKSGEVLAIYRNRNESGATTGQLLFLGVGRKPEVRDLILATFVAMGLGSAL